MLSTVKGLTESLVDMEAEAMANAAANAYCDREEAKTDVKHGVIMEDVSMLKATTDQLMLATTKPAATVAEIKQLEVALAALMNSKAEMDKLRRGQLLNTFNQGRSRCWICANGPASYA